MSISSVRSVGLAGGYLLAGSLVLAAAFSVAGPRATPLSRSQLAHLKGGVILDCFVPMPAFNICDNCVSDHACSPNSTTPCRVYAGQPSACAACIRLDAHCDQTEYSYAASPCAGFPTLVGTCTRVYPDAYGLLTNCQSATACP